MKIYNEEFTFHLYLYLEDVQKLVPAANCDSTIDNFIKDHIIPWCNDTFKYDFQYHYVAADQSYGGCADLFKFKSDNHRNMFILKWL